MTESEEQQVQRIVASLEEGDFQFSVEAGGETWDVYHWVTGMRRGQIALRYVDPQEKVVVGYVGGAAHDKVEMAKLIKKNLADELSKN